MVCRSSRLLSSVEDAIELAPMAPDLTVRDHVLLVATTWPDRETSAEARADDLLDELGLGWLGDRFPHELSSGQTQLFGLALVLARQFDVLVLDEPEQRMDNEHIALVIQVLRARRDAGSTLVIATHSAELAEELADRTLDLDAPA
ncbi:AAA family ATPase [Microbacterium amylolyticum]|nr:energy-coupling factor ABC transporter ATP-binding protein [Microbacterium amylolyticum]